LSSTDQKVKSPLSDLRPHLEVDTQSDFHSRIAVSSTVSKAIGIVDILASKSGQGINLAEMSALLKMPKSTTHRYLATLVELGLAERDASDRYRLGTKVLELAGSFLASSDLRNECQPFMTELAEKSEETIHLAVPSGTEVVYIAKIESRHAWGMVSHLGARFPMYCTALGKSILAFSDQGLLSQVTAQSLKSRTPKTITSTEALEAELSRVRLNGFALDDEENEMGICCVGAPIFDYTGSVIAAISISGPNGRIDRERCLHLGPLLRESAQKISRRRGFAGQVNFYPAYK
jgi:IclR family transcriptional regulator, KDG regulon repressor